MLPSAEVHLMAALAQAQADDPLPSVVAAVLRDGELGWSAARGRCVRRDSTERPDADTQYRIGSMTKAFVAALVLQLRDEGRLDLTDPVGTHVPEGPYPDRTLRSLLTHTSGMQAEPNGPWWERAPGRRLRSAHLRELLGVWHWGHMTFLMRTDGADLTLEAMSGGRPCRFGGTGEDTYLGLSGYHTGETLRVVRHAHGPISHLHLATWVYTRTPDDPRADVPAWHGPGDH